MELFSKLNIYALKFTKSQISGLVVALFCSTLVLVFSFPNYEDNIPYLKLEKSFGKFGVNFSLINFTAQNIQKKIENSFKSIDAEAGTHESKLEFRIKVPIIGNIFNLDVLKLVILQGVFYFLFFIFYFLFFYFGIRNN